MNKKTFINKWNVAYENKEQRLEFFSEMSKDLDMYTEEKTKELEEENTCLKDMNAEQLNGLLKNSDKISDLNSRLAIAEKALEEINECEYGDEDKISIIATDALSQIKQSNP